MGRSGLLGFATLLLLVVAAVAVLVQSGHGARLLAGLGGADADTAAVRPGGLDPRVQPFATPSTRADTRQADRMIRDIEAMGSATP